MSQRAGLLPNRTRRRHGDFHCSICGPEVPRNLPILVGTDWRHDTGRNAVPPRMVSNFLMTTGGRFPCLVLRSSPICRRIHASGSAVTISGAGTGAEFAMRLSQCRHASFTKAMAELER
jgi:hypothetical protein